MASATQQELDNAAAMLGRYGFEVQQAANNGFDPYLVVQDPVYVSGTGQSAGKLVFMGSEPVIVRDYNAARRFVNARV